MVEVKEAAKRGAMQQQCYMPLLYLNWVLYLGVIAWAGLTGRYFFSFVWALGFPAALLAYLAHAFGAIASGRAGPIDPEPVDFIARNHFLNLRQHVVYKTFLGLTHLPQIGPIPFVFGNGHDFPRLDRLRYRGPAAYRHPVADVNMAHYANLTGDRDLPPDNSASGDTRHP